MGDVKQPLIPALPRRPSGGRHGELCPNAPNQAPGGFQDALFRQLRAALPDRSLPQSITCRAKVGQLNRCAAATSSRELPGVKELPDLVEYGESFEEAYALAVDAIETTAAVFAEQGRPMPPPVEPADEYSGRVTLRIPRSLHRALAEAADAEGASLNQHLVNVLTYYSGYAAGVQLSSERKA